MDGEKVGDKPSAIRSFRLQIHAQGVNVTFAALVLVALFTRESREIAQVSRQMARSAEINALVGDWAVEVSTGARERTKFASLGRQEYLQTFEAALSKVDGILDTILIMGIEDGLASTVLLDDLRKRHLTYRRDVEAMEKSGTVRSVRNSDAFRIHELELKEGLLRLQATMGAERAEKLKTLDSAVQRMRDRMVKALTLWVILMVAILVLVDRRVLAPLKALTHSVGEIGRGNLGLRVEIRSRDEIGRLAAVFNKMSENLRQKRDSEVRLKKLETIDQLVRSVNHEINNPLMVISGNAEFLNMALPQLESNLKAKLETIVDEVQRIAEITQKLKEIREPITQNYTGEEDQMIDLARSTQVGQLEGG